MTSLIFAEQFYYPDGWGGAQIPRDITLHLVRSGIGVSVVCGSEPYAPIDGDPGPDPAQAGVRMIRLPRLFGGDIHSRKLLRQLWFYLLAMPALMFRGRADALVIQTNPPLLVPIAAIAARLRRIPLAIIAQDIYPEVLFAHGGLGPQTLPGRMLRGLFGWAYRSATMVIALGPTMAARLRAKGVAPDRIQLVSNWATGDEGAVRGADNELRREWQLEGKFVVLYSGNLGIAHEVEAIIHGLSLAAREQKQLRLVIIGKGSRLAEAKALVQRYGVEEYVLFKPLVPARLLPHSLGLADIALVTLRSGFEGLVVPSKLLGYMARGIPTAYIGPASDVSAMIEQSGGGTNLIDAGPEQVARELKRLAMDPSLLDEMGRRAQQFYDTKLSKSIALTRYRELMESLLSASTARTRRAGP